MTSRGRWFTAVDVAIGGERPSRVPLAVAATGPRGAVVLGYGEERPLDSVEALRDSLGCYAALGVDTIALLWPRGGDAAAQLDVLEHACGEGRERV